MKLGGSLARRRRSGRNKLTVEVAEAGKKRSTQIPGAQLLFTVLILIVLGWLGGYAITTRLIFPPPPPRGPSGAKHPSSFLERFTYNREKTIF